MSRRFLLVLTVAIVATVAPMTTARACSCVMRDPARFLAESDFVFAGSLVEQPAAAGWQIWNVGVDMAAYTFEVDAVYRGDIRDATVQVWSASNGAACGLALPVGEPVAIAASLFEGRLTSGSCSTFGVDQLVAAAAEAGIEPTIPTASPSAPLDVAGEVPDTSGGRLSGSSPLVIAAFAGLIVICLTVLSRRRTPD